MSFLDRREAGQRLAAALMRFRDKRPVVLALPRGGVPVGFEIATALNALLDVVLVRKIGHPWSPELAVGALAEGEPPERFIDEATVAELNVSLTYLHQETARQTQEIEHRRQRYRADRPQLDVRNRTAILVDDGIATGATMQAALRSVRNRNPHALVLAVPVAPASTLAALRPEVEEIVCLESPDDFGAVGSFYANFRPIEDAVVIDLLQRATKQPQEIIKPPLQP